MRRNIRVGQVWVARLTDHGVLDKGWWNFLILYKGWYIDGNKLAKSFLGLKLDVPNDPAEICNQCWWFNDRGRSYSPDYDQLFELTRLSRGANAT